MQQVFKAMSDETRREILRLLGERSMTAGEIAACFSISKPSISHHLNALKAADLVMAERRGQEIVYSLNTTAFQDALSYLLRTFGGKDDA